MPKRTLKSVRTQQRRDAILEALAAGNHVETACRMAGISKSAFYAWVHADPDFENAVNEAIARSEAELLRRIRDDASWQSKAWILERRWPERWGRRDRLESDAKIRIVADDPPSDAAPWPSDGLPGGVEIHSAGVRAEVGEDAPPGEAGDP